jgi:hypothetical protein
VPRRGGRHVIAVKLARARRRDREQDIAIGAAPAEMAAKRSANLVARRYAGALVLSSTVMKSHGLDDEARRTEAALQGVKRHERLLHRMKFSGTDAFDRHDGLARVRNQGPLGRRGVRVGGTSQIERARQALEKMHVEKPKEAARLIAAAAEGVACRATSPEGVAGDLDRVLRALLKGWSR